MKTYRGVSGLLHAPATLPTQTEPRYPLDKKLDGIHIYIQNILLHHMNKRSVKEGCSFKLAKRCQSTYGQNSIPSEIWASFRGVCVLRRVEEDPGTSVSIAAAVGHW
jgi:hypothetical protein